MVFEWATRSPYEGHTVTFIENYRGYAIYYVTGPGGLYGFVDPSGVEKSNWASTISGARNLIDSWEGPLDFVGPPAPPDLNNGDDDDEEEEPILSIVPVSVIIEAAPWLIQELIVMGLKALTVGELLEMITGQEFYSLDDVLQWCANVLRGQGDDFVGPPAPGVGHDPKDFKKGATKEGWYIKMIEQYEFGRKTADKKVWYKPYEDASRGKTGAVMNFREKCGYFQGKRVQAFDSRKVANRKYRKGYDDGADAQFKAQMMMGHTRPCAPQVFYRRGRRR
ncbi:hypothetical protein ES705_38167 [subsurface metagenome]